MKSCLLVDKRYRFWGLYELNYILVRKSLNLCPKSLLRQAFLHHRVWLPRPLYAKIWKWIMWRMLLLHRYKSVNQPTARNYSWRGLFLSLWLRLHNRHFADKLENRVIKVDHFCELLYLSDRIIFSPNVQNWRGIRFNMRMLLIVLKADSL